MGNILIGSLPGVWIGTQLVDRVPAAGLRPALGCVLLGSALGVLTKAGVDLPVVAIVGVAGRRRRASPALSGRVATALRSATHRPRRPA